MSAFNELRIQQLEEAITPFRPLLAKPRPKGGWLRSIREALGMTSVQLARRLGKASQSVEDIQKSEAAGTIGLDTLQNVAEALGCVVVYAVVPLKKIDEMRRDQAEQIARRILRRTTHSMALEAQTVGSAAERLALESAVNDLLAGKSRKLWE